MSFYFNETFCSLIGINHDERHNFDNIVKLLYNNTTKQHNTYYFSENITTHINECLKTDKTRFRECHIKSYVHTNILECEKYVQLQPYIPKNVTAIEITI